MRIKDSEGQMNGQTNKDLRDRLESLQCKFDMSEKGRLDSERIRGAHASKHAAELKGLHDKFVHLQSTVTDAHVNNSRLNTELAAAKKVASDLEARTLEFEYYKTRARDLQDKLDRVKLEMAWD